MNSYFKCFNEVNKVSNYIRDENNYINYNDLILDFIFEKEDLNLAKVIFLLVEDKILLIRFINILNICENEKETKWINVIFDNGFDETDDKNQIDIFASDNTLLKYSSKNGLIKIVKYLVENGADVQADNNIALRLASENGHLEIVKDGLSGLEIPKGSHILLKMEQIFMNVII